VKVTGKERNICNEALALIGRELIPPAAIARECGVSEETLMAWLSGKPIGADFICRIADFIDARATVARALAESGNPLRASFALRLISNVGNLLDDLESARADQRAEIHDHILMYILDVRRLIELMGGEKPPTLASMIHGELKPGDRMMIVRGGGKNANANG
jgi:hypothetical protein